MLFPAWVFVADNKVSKLQWLQKVLHTTGKCPRHTLVYKLHLAFQVLYVYKYIRKLCRQQPEIIQNHKNVYVTLEMVKPNNENVRGLNLV
jgi:hypothetical protein